MDKRKLFLMYFVLCLNLQNAFCQLKVDQSNNVGIGTLTPTYKLDVEGTCMRFKNWTGVKIDWTSASYGSAVLYPELDWYLWLGSYSNRIGLINCWNIISDIYTPSDERIKDNIKPLSYSLDKLTKLEPVMFTYNDSYVKNLPEKIKNKYTNNYNIGFIAQDVMKIFPELVQDTIGSELFSINYIGLIPILVNALKEQQYYFDSLKREVDINNKKQIITENFIAGNNTQLAKLIQPNATPFDKLLEIKYYIPENLQYSEIIIYDITGNLINRVAINKYGASSIIINANELKPGIYACCLMINNNTTDIRQIVITNNNN
jgi:hypothetical protein